MWSVHSLDTIRVVSVAGSVGQPAGSGRAVAVATWSAAGGGGALGIVRVAAWAATAIALRGGRVARSRGRRTGAVWVRGARGFRARNRLRVGVGRIVTAWRPDVGGRKGGIAGSL